ncbi:hypothetical protein [Streptomyces sp. UNOC14_S4]|uniref:hypothetical protein n=1 Tax=Streptomyces sp. UNOC14_S4 TaxID=2872340 RepID=UPI001E2E4607|nr:hypothetical protein [Streptomyces sp. UNOC14_S4]MCC3767505.1 hypothetical protein [Streptomyces sp. UNOC14_S4]
MTKKGKSIAWAFAVAIGFAAVSVVVDAVRGEELDWAMTAFLLIMLPTAVGEVLRAYGRDRAAARTGTVSNWLVLPAVAVLWAGLIVGWSRGEGTPWLPFTAAVLMPLGAAVLAVQALRKRRTVA